MLLRNDRCSATFALPINLPFRVRLMRHRQSAFRSLVQHLLSCLLEFTATVHVTNLLVGGGGSAVGSGVLRRRLLLRLRVLLVDNHSLCADGVLLGSGSKALVAFAGGASWVVGHAGLLSNDVEHGVFQGLLILGETVLLPGVVEGACIQVVPVHAAFKEAKASAIVGLLLEFKRAAVFHVLTELAGVAAAKFFKAGLDLLLLDVVVLLVLRAARQTLPGELALDEVEEHMTDSLQVITTTLLNTLVGGNRRISGGTSQVLAILVGDVLTIRVLVALGKTEIDDIDVITCVVGAADQEVVGLNVSVDDALLVNFFNTADQLRGNHQHCL